MSTNRKLKIVSIIGLLVLQGLLIWKSVKLHRQIDRMMQPIESTR